MNILSGKHMAKRRKKVSSLTPEQKRNSDIFRLRGFYANAKTLPFHPTEIKRILELVDCALARLDAETQTDYMKGKV